MSWFLFALIGPFLYAICNYTDKVLLEKYFKEGGVGTLILFTSLLSALALPFLFWADPTIFQMSIFAVAVLAVVSILNTLVLWFYFLAIKDDEASIVVVFYQLVPVLGLVLGYFILHETITQMQLFAMAIILLGTTIISFEVDEESHFRLRRKTIVYMLAASLCWALGSVTFKYVALEDNVVRSLFWEHLMLALVGIFIFIFVRGYRTHFLNALRTNSKAIISLNFANEVIYMAGTIIFSFSYMRAPISLVLLTNSFQAIFILIFGIFLGIYFPKISVEKIQLRHVLQKVAAILITGIGVYLLLAG